jgi:hypothetical protein
MIFENKRKDLNRIVREALNGRKDPWENYTPDLFGNQGYGYGLGDILTQKITCGKVAAAATMAYLVATNQEEGIFLVPLAYALGRVIDGSASIIKRMYFPNKKHNTASINEKE